MKIASPLALAAFGVVLAVAPALEAGAADGALQAAIASSQRTPKFNVRSSIGCHASCR